MGKQKKKGGSQDDSALLNMEKLERFTTPQVTEEGTTRYYRGAPKEEVTQNAATGRAPIRDSGENTITVEIHGAVAYARGLDGKQDGAISSFSLYDDMVAKGIEQGLLIEKIDHSRDYHAGDDKHPVTNIQATTKEGREYLRECVVPGSVKALDQDIPALYRPTKAQKNRGLKGLEALQRRTSDPSEAVPSEVFRKNLREGKYKKEGEKTKEEKKEGEQKKGKKKKGKNRGRRSSRVG
ncbi:hypothetical protein [Aquimarina mytili]|uniref:Uncharacterized protein n=1 Tax=Aquimarina mytili TaxID=874423 RepID=A0A936ZTG8_9FLAO|nr:hypothetical protein [Aquimarina mytili]MBL0683977.1 hypothetical protein [Aquimarina mytili]